jgi:hypothetical protein
MVNETQTKQVRDAKHFHANPTNQTLSLLLSLSVSSSLISLLPSPSFDRLWITNLTCDKADKLSHALLKGLFCIFGDLSLRWQHLFHDTCDVGNGEMALLLPSSSLSPSLSLSFIIHDSNKNGATSPGNFMKKKFKKKSVASQMKKKNVCR